MLHTHMTDDKVAWQPCKGKDHSRYGTLGDLTHREPTGCHVAGYMGLAASDFPRRTRIVASAAPCSPMPLGLMGRADDDWRNRNLQSQVA